jgi:gliding motility-associated lipoprotein GldH
METMKKYNFVALTCFVVFSVMLLSCNHDILTSQIQKLPEEGWKTENKLKFDVDVKDHAPYYNVFLNVRHADSYPFRNVFVFLTTVYPEGKTTVDTIECILANKNGEWQGDGAGDIWDNKIPLSLNKVCGWIHFHLLWILDLL